MSKETNVNQPTTTPLDGRNFTIGVLSMTATILFVGFLLVTSMPGTARGIGHLDRQDDYILLTHQLSNARENVIVVDAAVKTAIVYELRNQRDLQLVQRLPLDRLPLPDRK